MGPSMDSEIRHHALHGRRLRRSRANSVFASVPAQRSREQAGQDDARTLPHTRIALREQAPFDGRRGSRGPTEREGHGARSAYDRRVLKSAVATRAKTTSAEALGQTRADGLNGPLWSLSHRDGRGH